MQALGTTRTLNASIDPAEASSRSYGTFVGYDWGGPRRRGGLAGGYTRDDLDASGARNGIDAMAYRALAYGEVARGIWFTDVIAAGARHVVDGGRDLSFTARLPASLGSSALFGGVNREAAFAFDAYEWSGGVESGVRVSRGGIDLRGSAGLQAVRMSREAFDESGADSLSLSFAKQALSSQTARLRVSAGRALGRMRLRGDVRYDRELGATDLALDASIAGVPFTLAGFQLPRDAISARAGAGVRFGAVTLNADYRFAAANGLRQHLLSVGVSR
jgi:uncharacterized protein with beta-barrel porin domain